MTVFWLLGAALAAGVLAWVLWPLLWRKGAGPMSRRDANVSIYRDQLRELEADLAAGTLAQADYERSRAELEARLLEDVRDAEARDPGAPAARPAGRGAALALGAAIPVLALLVYLAVGNPATLSLQVQHGETVQQLESMVARLAARMRENPDDAQGWQLLGRSYAALGRYAESVDAYAQAAVRAPQDAQLLVDFADVLAMARGQRLEGEPEKLIRRALEIDPDNLKGLALAGSAAFERKDFAQAAAYWQRMLPLVPADSEDARTIQQNVAEASSLSKEAAQAALQGTVSLSPKLAGKAAPDDTVFVFARAAQGPPMPLAVARTRVRDLPYRFRLDDSMAMTPAMRLSSFPRVVVGARVSKSGNATPQPGDLQGASAPVANDAGEVRVVIDRVVP